MACGGGGGGLAFCVLWVLLMCDVGAGMDLVIDGKRITGLPEAKDLGALASGFLKKLPVGSGPAASMVPEPGKYPMILAGERTRRPDVLNHLSLYEGGWNVTNKHYWASVSFTGVVEFVVSILWLVCFGAAVGASFYCRSRRQKGNSSYSSHIGLVLLLTCCLALTAGFIILFVGQNDFNAETSDTLNFVLHQSDFVVQTLRNVTGFLSFAKGINVEDMYLPSDVQARIDSLEGDLSDAADTIEQKTEENYGSIREILKNVHISLIVVAVVVPVLALLGYVLSVFMQRRAAWIYMFICWPLVGLVLIASGTVVIINSATKDTCEAMDQWVHYPQAETALSNILPCVDEATTNQTLYQSKEVVGLLVKIVNMAISSSIKRSSKQNSSIPLLCSPYNSQLHDRRCKPTEVAIANASMAWLNYTCPFSAAGSCSGERIIPWETYGQLEMAVDVSYALYHYVPLLLNFRDCKFVRETFSIITSVYCSFLENDLRLVSSGLALVFSGFALCLLWVLHANRPRREEVFAEPVGTRIAPSDTP